MAKKNIDLSFTFRRIICYFLALVMAASVALVVSIGVASGMLRSEPFIQARYERYNQVLLDEVNKAMEGAAEEAGLPVKAYTSAIQSGHIQTALHQASSNTVRGYKTDFSDSTYLYSYYHAGLLNYCKENGIPVTDEELNKAACFAVDVFNSVVGDESTKSIIIFALTYTKHPLVTIIAAIITFIACIIAIDFMAFGKHKKYDYIGISLITGGEALIILPAFALLMKYTSLLRFMDVNAYNLGLADVLNDILKIYIAIGVVILMIGIVVTIINYNYYARKNKNIQTERDIRRKIMEDQRSHYEATHQNEQ